MPDDLEEVPRRRNLTLWHSLIPVGKIVFANRLLLGLFVVAIAALFVRPVFPRSPEEAIVTEISVILIISGVILRAWAAGCTGNHTRMSSIEPGKLSTNRP